MDDLCPRRVWGFSTGCILAPRRWTLDVASHHLAHTYRKGGEAATSSAAPGSNVIPEDALPLGTSSNTARFESMDETGATLYVTELFVPRASALNVPDTAAPDALGQSNWCVERLRASLLRHSSWRAGPAHGVDSALSAALAVEKSGCAERERAPLCAWVVEVTAVPRSPTTLAVVPPATSTACATTATSISIAAALQPFFRLFLEVVWDGGASASAASGAVDDAAHRILAYLESLYRTPALELDGFRFFTANPAACGVPSGDPTRVCPQTSKMSTRASAVTNLREPCAPHVLVAMGDDALSSVWGVSLYSAAGAAFVQLLIPSCSSLPPPPLLPRHQSAVNEAHSLKASCSLFPISAFPACSDVDAASAVQRLLQHDLQLCWEGLSLSMTVAGVETVVAVGALQLDDACAMPSSIYSFPSVEQAWEAHVHRAMHQQCRQEHTRGWAGGDSEMAGVSARHETVSLWELRRLSTSSRPISEELDAVLRKGELQKSALDDPSLSSGERSMRLVVRDIGAPPVAPRWTSYLLRIRRGSAEGEQVHVNSCEHSFAAAQGTSLSGVAHTDAGADELYVLQLHAPRVLSTHALIVCLAVPTSLVADEGRLGKRRETEEGADTTAANVHDAASLAAAALGSAYRMAPYVPSLWLPREVALRGGSGVCSRSGRLLLHVSPCDARYTNIHLAPVASNAFTTLGSIIAWTSQGPVPHQGAAARCEESTQRCGTSSFVSPTSTGLVNTSAVWTLIGDGRSAAAYLEDALSEYMYDTGAKSLLNVGQPSQHECQPGLLVVRRSPKQRYSMTGSASGSSSAAGTVSSLVGVQEVCAAWLDVGTAHRLFLSVRDVGVGEVLVVKGSLVGPHTEYLRKDGGGCDAATAARETASRAEEATLESWIGGITASVVAPPRQ
ncbi:hypothetical protein LSCM1_07296 [Leishmania martiniquensis]|uniref:Uncharacterized protein n=1 Tax=Leishmania martiniquensis TaxID=1580590 RepID=A0A836GQ81_9TRYP|nr:hypothetical protein LSCM1_07296 [Leishmania martiniquensis]